MSDAPASVAPPAPVELTSAQKVFTLVGVLMALFLAALDQTVVATAAPKIMQDLQMDPALFTWITTAYLLGSTVMVPVFGKLSDLWGRKIIVVSGVVIFLAASALCGFAQTSEQLIAFRGLQGIGSAALFTTAFAIVADIFSPAERGRYTGIFGAAFGLSSLVGPLLGGFITDTYTWHWIFFINMPLGSIALLLIVLRMPMLKPVRTTRPSLDLAGALLLALSVIPFLLAASFGRVELAPNDNGYLWGSPQILGLLALSVVSLATFIWWELRAKEPLIELRLFKTPMVAWGSATVFVMGAAFLTPMAFLPMFMVNVVGVSNTASGLTISPLVMGIVVGNVTSGQLVSRTGRYKPFMIGALLILIVGFSVMAFTLTPTSTQGEVTLKMILLGLGLGPSIPLYTLAIQNAAPVQNIGVVTSMSTFFRQMGSTFGLAVVGSFFATTLSTQMKANMADATRELPPQLVQRLLKKDAKPGQVGEDSNPKLSQRFDAAGAKQKALDQLEGAKNIAIRAIRGEAFAIGLVETNPLASEQLRATAKNGGARAQVRRSYEGNWGRLLDEASKPDTWARYSHSEAVPPVIRPEVTAITPDQLRVQTSVEPLLAPIRAKYFAGETEAEEHALKQQLAMTEAFFSETGPKISSAIDAVEAAIKLSWTKAVTTVYFVAIALAVLALLLTLMIPQLPLRKLSGAQARAAAQTPPVE